MKKSIRIWLITATALIVFGATLFGFAACSPTGNIKALFNQDYTLKTHEITEEFSDLSINTDTADIIFAKSSDRQCKVECFESDKLTHSVSVQDGVLTIKPIDKREWFDHIRLFSFSKDKITVYLPQTEYRDLTLETDTGDVQIPNGFKVNTITITGSTGNVNVNAYVIGKMEINISTGNIRLSDTTAQSLALSLSTGNISVQTATIKNGVSVHTSTGDTCLTNLTCNTFSFDSSTGELEMRNVVATEKFTIDNGTGDVKFERCDASEISVTVSTGDVTGTLLSDKIFIVDTSTGKKDVPKTTTGGICEITTSTGDVKIEITQ